MWTVSSPLISATTQLCKPRKPWGSVFYGVHVQLCLTTGGSWCLKMSSALLNIEYAFRDIYERAMKTVPKLRVTLTIAVVNVKVEAWPEPQEL